MQEDSAQRRVRLHGCVAAALHGGVPRRQVAGGNVRVQFAEMLVAECNSYWQSGRQMCDELSLTGNYCTNRRRVLPGQESSVQVFP